MANQYTNKININNADIRYLYDIKDVLYDQKWAKNAPNSKLYYMIRGIKQINNLRYDITIIPFQMLGQEFIKTKGHEHSKSYQELYEVLKGNAIFLMQKRKSKKSSDIQDVYIVKAKQGDKVLIPVHYGHITINPGPLELEISNWISVKCKPDYSFLEQQHGACYFFTKRGWIKNKHYSNVPKLRVQTPNQNIPLITRSTTTI